MKVHNVSKCFVITSALEGFYGTRQNTLAWVDRRSEFRFFFRHRFFLSVGHMMSNGPSSFDVQCCYYSAPGEIQLTVYSAAHEYTTEDKTDKHMINLLRGGRPRETVFSVSILFGLGKAFCLGIITFKEKNLYRVSFNLQGTLGFHAISCNIHPNSQAVYFKPLFPQQAFKTY